MYNYFQAYWNSPYRQVFPFTWTPSKVTLNQTLRTLWEQHVYWTRLTVNSIIGRQPDENVTTERLLRNAVDFEAVLRPLYGAAVAERFGDLLRNHLTIAAELVKALRDNQQAAAADANRRWFANADAIAEFLSRINPHWSREEWRRMLYEHLRLLSSEVSSRVTGNYTENVALNDQIEPQALQMADTMTTGIIQQFPAAFSR
ncbi:acetylglutamate kinase [Paenibacillus nanensis]|uniref:Acetylglutamate kinase n=1 Tax=Paenibacillus nanensis TaxID=393251 RepID=A0A3A1VHQ8_9BACL|nr:acetylglutamate kinase [Paenibacillus nanensis]RIX60468.1 acetylglutamate kinase [Paenibacillus nanensis]